jgi:hypothetical protein
VCVYEQGHDWPFRTHIQGSRVEDKSLLYQAQKASENFELLKHTGKRSLFYARAETINGIAVYIGRDSPISFMCE